jgi:3-oxoadipate enol-lactonase
MSYPGILTRLVVACAVVLACGGRTALPEARVGRVTLPGTWLYYEEVGSGPPVVLLEGGNLPLGMWDDQVPALASRYRVVRYDVRGFGRSGPYAGPYEAQDDLRALLDTLGVRRAHLVGLSLGGRIAIDFALHHPDRVGALVLAGPGLGGFPWSPPDSAWMAEIAGAIGRRDSVRAVELWLRSPYMVPAMERPELRDRIRGLALRNSSMWVQPDSERVPTPPAIARLGELRAPTLVVVGTREHPDILRIVDTLGARVPHARRVVLDGAGHMLNLERPREFERAVLDFLASPAADTLVRGRAP